ncbi:MAG TPA: hypothetical protein VGA30_07175 [Actinomycetota bacterium]
MSGQTRSVLRWPTAIAVVAAAIAWSSVVPAGAITNSVSINFDDVTAPCAFNQTVALTNEYSSQGVLFRGPGPMDGGGILNECGNFGVSGYSAPNFLAFNSAAFFLDGGIPRGPELIIFTSGLMSHVQINVGSSQGGLLRLQAYNSSKQLIASSMITMSSALATVSVDVVGIKAVRLRTGTSIWVADDLSAS